MTEAVSPIADVRLPLPDRRGLGIELVPEAVEAYREAELRTSR